MKCIEDDGVVVSIHGSKQVVYAVDTCDFEQRQIKWIEMNEGCSPYMGSYMPHFNSLSLGGIVEVSD